MVVLHVEKNGSFINNSLPDCIYNGYEKDRERKRFKILWVHDNFEPHRSQQVVEAATKHVKRTKRKFELPVLGVISNIKK